MRKWVNLKKFLGIESISKTSSFSWIQIFGKEEIKEKERKKGRMDRGTNGKKGGRIRTIIWH